MAMAPHESMTEKRRAVGILDVSVEEEKIQAFGVDNTRFHVFNVLDGDTGGTPDSIRRAFQFVDSKMPSDKKWNRVKVGTGVRYTPSNDCPAGAKTLASHMSILKGTNEKERKKLYPALAAVDERVNREVKAHVGNDFVFSTPFSLLRTPNGTEVQSCHLDENPEISAIRENQKYEQGHSAILAATQAGSYLLVFPDVPIKRLSRIPEWRDPWVEANDPRTTKGKLIFIPFGWCVIFNHSILHAGGFRSLDDIAEGNGNLRFFYYIVPEGVAKPDGNWDAHPNGKSFSVRFVNPLSVKRMKTVFFYD